jgi:hypothetical protein
LKYSDYPDIVDRIRGYSVRFKFYGVWSEVMEQAIVEIEQLRKERDALIEERGRPKFIFDWVPLKERAKGLKWW